MTIAQKLGIDSAVDPSAGVLEQPTRPENLLEQMDQSLSDEDGKAPP